MTVEHEVETVKKTKPMGVRKSARRRAREFVIQGLFQWQLNPDSGYSIATFLEESSPYFMKADKALFQKVFFGCLEEITAIQAKILPHLDRPQGEVSPIENAILISASYELIYILDTPYAVVLNEAIELAKTFGGTDGHKFINGILDKIAHEIRPHEVRANKK